MVTDTKPSAVRRRKTITLGLITLAVLIASLLTISNRSAVGQAPPATESPEVGVFEAALRKTSVPREFVARIDADSTVEIRARVEGFLDKQLFKDGSMVKAGALL